MKTILELRRLMKDKRYSGAIQERDADFIREVEQGFKVLFPLRECHPEKVDELISSEKEARAAQLTVCYRAIQETDDQIASFGKLTDEIEQTQDLKKIRKHLLLLEETKLYHNILHGRLAVISALVALANSKYLEALELTHDCYGCRNLMKQQQAILCGAGWESGKQPRAAIEIDKCPDPTGQELDWERTSGRGKKDLPQVAE
jgi:hypothetical protein